MRIIKLIILATTWLIIATGCGGSSYPIPYLVDQDYELQEGCITDFSKEVGDCVTLRDGFIDPVCKRVEEECLEHFYITRRNGRPYFVHVNAAYPCYPDWIYQEYRNEFSDYFQDSKYRVVEMQLAGTADDDVVHIVEQLKREELQEPSTCYYRLETSIEDLVKGEYKLKLWSHEKELLLKMDFDN